LRGASNIFLHGCDIGPEIVLSHSLGQTKLTLNRLVPGSPLSMTHWSLKLELLAGDPSVFTAIQKQEFIDLVRLGDEIGELTLRTNVPRSRLLAFIRDGVTLLGVGALKIPQSSYRKKFFARTGVAISEADYPYELGYVFVAEASRGNGHAGQIVGACIEAEKEAGIFATTRADNKAMHRLLHRFGFNKAGKSYNGGHSSAEIGLFLRPAGVCFTNPHAKS
jgi:GNAT superfamily N-acetyltransferase